MAAPETNDQKEKMGGETKQKPRIMLDNLHDEALSSHDKLVEILSEHCEITVLGKKPVVRSTAFTGRAKPLLLLRQALTMNGREVQAGRCTWPMSGWWMKRTGP